MHSAKTAPWPPPSSRNLEDTLKSPTHLFLNKTAVRKGSNMSINELIVSPPPAGIRAQIGHLLPRHAQFRARVHIHQISSVPFVSGEFAVRWKFKGVQSCSATKKKGLLGRVKAKANNKGKEREFDAELVSPMTANYDVFPITPILVHPDASAEWPPPPTDRSTSLSSTDMNASSSVSSQPTLHWADSSSSSHLDANASHVTMTPDSTLLHDPLAVPPISSAHRRGMTPFFKLIDHSVIWSHKLDTLLKFDIDRENSQIHRHPLKLVVMQRVIPDDPDGSPQNPRLGAVYLNLAEYIGKGSVERKYLLKESKTNAVLKLTIELEHVSGETTYIAPPLPKGEILNEISGFLDNGGVRKRPRALNLYGPYRDQEELENDLLGTARSGRLPRSARSQRTIVDNGTTTPMDSDSEEEPYDMYDLDDGDSAFDIQRLPHAYGTKTTETIIEALFNPVKIADMRYETPFTIYEPAVPARLPTKSIGLGLRGVPLDANGSISKRQQSDGSSSFYGYSTASSSSASLHTTTTSSSKGKSRESGGGGSKSGSPHGGSIPESHVEEMVESLTTATTTFGGMKGWWKRHGTHRHHHEVPPLTARASPLVT